MSETMLGSNVVVKIDNALDEGADQLPVQTITPHRAIILDYDSDERDLDSALSQLIVYEVYNAGIRSRYAYDHELPKSPQELLDQIAKGWYTVYMVDGGAVTVYLPFELIDRSHFFADYFDDQDEEDAEDE